MPPILVPGSLTWQAHYADVSPVPMTAKVCFRMVYGRYQRAGAGYRRKAELKLAIPSVRIVPSVGCDPSTPLHETDTKASSFSKHLSVLLLPTSRMNYVKSLCQCRIIKLVRYMRVLTWVLGLVEFRGCDQRRWRPFDTFA